MDGLPITPAKRAQAATRSTGLLIIDEAAPIASDVCPDVTKLLIETMPGAARLMVWSGASSGRQTKEPDERLFPTPETFP